MASPSPAADEFVGRYNRGEAQLVWLDTISDLETPVAAYLKLTDTAPYSFLLESVADGDIKGRYSIIGWAPDLLFRVRDLVAEINQDPAHSDKFEAVDDAPLDALRSLLQESAIDMPEALASMSAGIFGYLSYDMVRAMEKLPDENPRTINVPDSIFMRPTMVAVFDTITDTLKLVTAVRPKAGVDAQEAYARAEQRLREAETSLFGAIPTMSSVDTLHPVEPRSNMPEEAFHNMVKRARDYIEAGDIFQVVVSQRFSIDFPIPAFDLYRSLRRINPSPYLFFLNFDGFSVVGSSPEILVGVKHRTVNIRPIAGTRRRGSSVDEDAVIAADLLSDAKEIAEHLMLLDLGRNDVGRVSEIGSVAVDTAFAIQKTSHLIHIVSNITGRLREDCDTIDALQAGFPAGTVSGAPKIRAMEIIDELEPHKREIYSGCIGYFSANGDMDTCIALRTGVVKDGQLYVQAGGGIVYDSTPEYEFTESVNKCLAVVRAAEDALRVSYERVRHNRDGRTSDKEVS